MGCTVRTVCNGMLAIEALSQEDFDLVLMDCQMPELDGLEATRRIRRGVDRVLNVQVPIVALTANASKDDRDECLLAGMNDYLAKPFEVSELISVLDGLQLPRGSMESTAQTGQSQLVIL